METIKSNLEVSCLFKNGRYLSNKYLTLIITTNTNEHDQQGRVVFIAGKKLGNAVWRNQAKRRMRAISYDLGGPWLGYDVGFVAKAHTTKVSYSKVLNACKDLLIQHGIVI